ncbi:uncharacterized protein LOC109726339 [Ananas comosus]|uniref:Uncharacterized protein LOC109726339 n=1 Tax=Ananas comosus TaxID=4615 RepID=A0A6P5H0C2_ANACO|nr:uncharacterized protein LOC109726339 [Ananas comosus]
MTLLVFWFLNVKKWLCDFILVVEMGSKRQLNQMVVVLLLSFTEVLSCVLGEAGDSLSLGSQFGPDKILMEMENDSESANSLLIRTQRVDPLDDFKKYRGGYNITNKHYWSSTIFTGRIGYIIAALWFVGGITFSGFLLVTRICFRRKRKQNERASRSERDFLWPIILGLFFTFIVIVASGVIIGSSSKFHLQARSIKNIITRTAEEASTTIYNVTEAVAAMQNITELFGGRNGSDLLNSNVESLSIQASNIQAKAESSMHLVNKGINTLEVISIITVTLNMIVVLALLAARTVKLQNLSSLLIIVCWLSTFLLWAYFGLYFFLYEFSSDTCAALDEYQLNAENSTLSSILPCRERFSADTVLQDVGEEIHDTIDQVNEHILSLGSSFLSEIAYVCNPFSGAPDNYTYQPENCSSNTTKIGDIPQVLKRYACSNRDSETCNQREFISASDYHKVLIYTNLIQNILNVYPGMERLVNCQTVKEAFSEILSDHCKPWKKYARITWGALACLSTVMVVLVLVWTIEALYEYKSHFSDWSIKPHSSLAEASEIDADEMDPAKLKLEGEP